MSIDYTNYSNMSEFESDEEKTIDRLSAEIDDITSDELDISENEGTEDDVSMGTIVNCDRVYIRENPSVQSNPVTNIPSGKDILVMKKLEGWYKVCTESGVEGYIMADFVEIA